MPEPVISLLRARVVNRSPLFYFSDGFEQTGSGVTATLFHSLGTEAGTDNSISYWTVLAGVPTFASHILTVPANAAIQAGHSDWGDCTVTVRLNAWNTGQNASLRIHFVDTNNYIEGNVNGANLFLTKKVAGTVTSVTNPALALTTGTAYWLQIVAAATTYTVNVYNDSAGAIGTLKGSTSGTISDSAVQNGPMGLSGTSGNMGWGGAFANVCQVTGTPPDGTQGQAWAPVVTTGEPAFAWSKVNPQAGTFSASIQLANSAGNGSWQQNIRLFAGTNGTITAQAKASAGTANVGIGALTTGNAGTTFGQVSATGAVAANPLVSCNYSGAVGTAYFDSLSYTDPAYEITNDLPHLHQTHIEVVAMQPGNPGSSALGSWTCQLFPPGTEGYAAAKAIYDKLDYFHRVEFYISHDGKSLGKLYYAGIITGIRKGYGTNSVFELSGVSDIGLLNLSKPFPAEAFQLGYGTGISTTADYRQARNYFGTNEPGWTDTFNPYVAANYISTNLPSLTSGTWTSTTDNGLNVISCSTGTGAILLAKSGTEAQSQGPVTFVELNGRLLPSADTTNAGGCGVGFSTSNANGTSSIVGWVRAKKNGSTGHWDLDVLVNAYVNSALTQSVSSSALTSVDDADGFISIGLSFLVANATITQGPSLVVNGKTIFWPGGTTAVGWNVPQINLPGAGNATNNLYPFVAFMAPATGSATAYLTNLVQENRFVDDLNPNKATFKSGVIGTPAHSLLLFSQVDPTFLEVITRIATRETWYWRYTPQAYTVGTRTLGTIDLTTDPGTDRGTNQSVAFNRSTGNLVELQLSANADQFVAGTLAAGPPGTDGGGLASWHDISSLTKYGSIDDQILHVTAPTFVELSRAANSISNNRVNLTAAGSKTAVVLRDPQTADVWRELDKVMIHDPEMGINYLVARVIAYTFDEGQATQTLTLDQFSVDDPNVPLKRLQQGTFQVAAKFNTR